MAEERSSFSGVKEDNIKLVKGEQRKRGHLSVWFCLGIEPAKKDLCRLLPFPKAHHPLRLFKINRQT